MSTMQFSEGDECPPAARYQSKQLLNNIVDGMSTIRPSAIYAEIPTKSDTYDSGYRSITYRALANAINGVAWFLENTLGKSSDHQTLAYIGPNDITYVMMILGAVKAGYKVSHPLLVVHIHTHRRPLTAATRISPQYGQ